MNFSNVEPDVLGALRQFVSLERVSAVERYGSGHINSTYCVVCKADGESVRYILQCLSPVAFPEPDKVMENFIRVTSHLKAKIEQNGGDAKRETLSVIKTLSGEDYFTAIDGKVWRFMPFIEDSVCYQQATAETFEVSAFAFGRFQYLLNDFAADTLHETIKDFHNTADRLLKFKSAVAEDKMGRAKDVQTEINFVLAREADCHKAVDALAAGILPLRVTHNDTKLNNVLIDAKSGQGICVIDLDTTMPGLSIYDFGDSIRFGANHSAEDEQDLGKVEFDISLFECYTRGFLSGTRGILTEAELEYLPWGARLMTLECGMRFLTDYLQGDTYFHTEYPHQNLYRCRTQFKLLVGMEEKFEAMQEIVKKYS